MDPDLYGACVVQCFTLPSPPDSPGIMTKKWVAKFPWSGKKFLEQEN